MTLEPLSKLSDWQLMDARQDIRGRPLIGTDGRRLGTVRELLVDIENERVAAIRTDSGGTFPVEPLEIREKDVIVRPGGTQTVEARAGCMSLRTRRPTGTISAKELRKAGVQAKDGGVGHLEDFYFDDQTWHIRFLVVATSHGLPERMVLISPESVSAGPNDKDIKLNLMKNEIRDSPDVSSHLPVSRQQQVLLAGYYGWAAVPRERRWLP